MKNIKLKKNIYIVNPDYLKNELCDSYKFELYIEKDRQDVKKKYDNCHEKRLSKNGLESTIKDVTLLRICQVLEKLKYMEKSNYFNVQDIAVLSWLESEFKTILKDQEQSEVEKSEDNKKELKRRVEDARKNND